MASALIRSALAATALLALANPARADITVGFITSLSGTASSLGVLYGKGINAAYDTMPEVAGQKVKLIQLDDSSDPATATRNARKLVQEDHVDVLIGTSSATSTIAIAAVAAELHVPLIAISPIPPTIGVAGDRWVVVVPQTPQLMVKAITDRMARDKTQTIGYIGFADPWGDMVYNGAKAAEARDEIKVTTNERYARTDTSVTGQILKVVATRPEGVLDGGSGTQAALPLLALSERGYKGKLYGTPALVNADFIRVAGKSANDVQVSAGPVIVADQLPEGHYAKAVSLAFRQAYLKVNGAPTTDGFSAYSFDSWLIFADAAKRAMATVQPGTPEFHQAMRDAIFKIKELPGTEGIYTFTQESLYGVDDRSLVILRLVNGQWTYAP
jgi:branched-chain amino acid transport system substrate-binding protein